MRRRPEGRRRCSCPECRDYSELEFSFEVAVLPIIVSTVDDHAADDHAAEAQAADDHAADCQAAEAQAADDQAAPDSMWLAHAASLNVALPVTGSVSTNA